MRTTSQHPTQFVVNRRAFLSQAACGFGTVALAAMLGEQALHGKDRAAANDPFTPRPPHFSPKCRNVIFLYMDGGPSQVDTFDPKPRLTQDNGKPFSMKIEPTQF